MATVTLKGISKKKRHKKGTGGNLEIAIGS